MLTQHRDINYIILISVSEVRLQIPVNKLRIKYK